MPVSSVLCHLCRHLVSGHIVSHQVSPSQLWSPTIPLSVYRHLQDLSRGIIFISPLNMSKPSQSLLSEEFICMMYNRPLVFCITECRSISRCTYVPRVRNCMHGLVLFNYYVTACLWMNYINTIFRLYMQSRCGYFR